MRNSQIKSIPALALGIFGIATTAQASLITTVPDLPPLGGVYLSTDVHQIFGGPALEFILSLPQHKVIVDELKMRQGNDEVETFFSSLDANLEVKVNGVTVQNGPIQANGPTTTIVFGRVLSPTVGDFDTEMLSMNLSGGTLPPGVMIRESPTLPSLGHTTITDIGGGLYQIDSFFDVFTELSTDGGLSWMPSNNGAGHVELVPEPTSLSLLAAGLVGMMGFIRRRR